MAWAWQQEASPLLRYVPLSSASAPSLFCLSLSLSESGWTQVVFSVCSHPGPYLSHCCLVLSRLSASLYLCCLPLLLVFILIALACLCSHSLSEYPCLSIHLSIPSCLTLTLSFHPAQPPVLQDPPHTGDPQVCPSSLPHPGPWAPGL